MEINPLSIILVKSDSKGDRMLFRYPHTTNHERDSSQCTKRKNPYSLIIAEDLLQVRKPSIYPNKLIKTKINTLYVLRSCIILNLLF